MGVDAALQPSSTSCSATNVKLVLVMLTLVCESFVFVSADADQVASPVHLGEVADEIGNPTSSEKDTLPSSLNPMLIKNENDMTMYKRHLGAVAALAGSRQLTGSNSFIPPSKKHLGSVAAAVSQFAGRNPGGRKLDLILPPKAELYKRHLGALMALSGAKGRPVIRSLKESPGYQMDTQSGTFELEAQPMSFTSDNILTKTGGIGKGSDADIIIPYETQSLAPGSLLEYADEILPSSSSEDEFHRMNSDEIMDQNLGRNDLDESDVITYKSKRFLGPLARGGWFPRHFRGIVSENNFGKRHIGALARLGWMPQAKGNSRLALMMDEQRGEIGLKRNDALPRRRMLYHFTAPSLWTSPRGK